MKKIFGISFFLALTAIICYGLVYKFPIWSFHFKAPQYPQGLELKIFLNGTQGDVSEIDIINHYIGMQKLDDAAKVERSLSPYVLIVLSLLSLIVGLFPHKKISRLLGLPMLFFPVAFVSFFYLWLYKFGHDLNPAAPVRLAPFTPTILGTGIIGQFTTFAVPSSGFYLISLAAVLILSILLRKR